MNCILSNLYKFVSFVQIYPEDGIIHRHITYHNGASTVRLAAIAGLLFLLRRKAAAVEKIGESVFPDHRWRTQH
jgi:hypothetical protein